MHITQESDYAVRIVYCLAREARRMDARTISEQMAISLRFSLKILGNNIDSRRFKLVLVVRGAEIGIDYIEIDERYLLAALRRVD